MYSYFSTGLPAPSSSLFYVLFPRSDVQMLIWITHVTPSEKEEDMGTETHSLTVCRGYGYLGKDGVHQIGSKAKNHLLGFLS